MECDMCNFSKCICQKESDKVIIDEESVKLDSSRSHSTSNSSINTKSTTQSTKSFTCSKCDITFKNKQTLTIHQATSDKCSKSSESSDLSKTCNYCNTEFSSKQMKKYHDTKCRNKIVSDITEEYEKKIQELHKHYNDIINSMKNK